MPKRRDGTSLPYFESVIVDAFQKLKDDIQSLRQTGPSSMQADEHEKSVDPAPWETMLNWPFENETHHTARARDAKPWDTSVYYHPGWTSQLTGETIDEGWKALSSYAVYAPKIYGDKKTNKVDAASDAPHRFSIHPSHDRAYVRELYLYNGVAGGGSCTVRLHNLTRGIIVATATIPGGSKHSTTFTLDDGGDPAEPNNMVFEYNAMWLECTAASGKGLGAYVSVA